MAGNNRVFFACHYIAIGPYGAGSGIPIHGLQSVNLNTTFSLEQLFELGQINIYQNVEQIPNVELTAEKVMDGYPLIYHAASPTATSTSLLNRTNQRADVILSIFSDAQDSASGTPLSQALCSGMYLSSLNYTLPVQGPCRESITLVGNDKSWRTAGFAFDGHFDNTDEPAAVSGVNFRQMVKMGPAPGGSVWPTQIPGMTVANGSGYNVESAGEFGAHLQDVTISCSLGREDLFELGRRKPYYRYANFPVPVNCTINRTAGGTDPGDGADASSDTANLVDEPILIKLMDGTAFNLGDKNKLQSITYSGGDATGGVVTIAYNYQNFNVLTITSDSDPAGL